MKTAALLVTAFILGMATVVFGISHVPAAEVGATCYRQGNDYMHIDVEMRIERFKDRRFLPLVGTLTHSPEFLIETYFGGLKKVDCFDIPGFVGQEMPPRLSK